MERPMIQADSSTIVQGAVPATGNLRGISRAAFYNDNRPMGFERAKAQPFCGSEPIGPEYPLLGDYLALEASPYDDPDAEQASWPEVIDQTRLGRWCGQYDFEDAEEDDDDRCITDGPHDEIEEEGI